MQVGDKWLRESFSNHPVRWSVAIPLVPVALSLGVAMFGPTTVVQAFQFDHAAAFSIAAVVRVVFVLSLGLAFIITQYVRVRGEGDRRRAELDEQDRQVRAYAVLPSLEFMFNLKSRPFNIIERAMAPFGLDATPIDLDTIDAKTLNDELDNVSAALRIALAALVDLAKAYGHPRRLRQGSVRYGGSIMLLIPKASIPTLPESFRTTPEFGGKLRFLDPEVDAHKLDGILILNEDLLLQQSSDEDATRTRTTGRPPYPELALPVRRPSVQHADGSKDTSMVLPGGPHAILGDVAQWITHAQTFMDDKRYRFSGIVLDKLRAYFRKGGEGDCISSLLSMRIGTGDKPLGVINFDADIENFLGDRSVHYETFSAFIRPSVVLLRPALRRYAEVWWRLSSQGS